MLAFLGYLLMHVVVIDLTAIDSSMQGMSIGSLTYLLICTLVRNRFDVAAMLHT